jgi:catechol 2,3-dioxygenase-like lactoylglutathione lyase family enzyme
MDRKLDMLYMPVHDIQSSLIFYRDHLGLEEAGQEGDTTIIFNLPGTDVKLMIDQHGEHIATTPGPLFMLPSVDEFYAHQLHNISFVQEPIDFPIGRWAAAKDPTGNTIYFVDMSKSTA